MIRPVVSFLVIRNTNTTFLLFLIKEKRVLKQDFSQVIENNFTFFSNLKLNLKRIRNCLADRRCFAYRSCFAYRRYFGYRRCFAHATPALLYLKKWCWYFCRGYRDNFHRLSQIGDILSHLYNYLSDWWQMPEVIKCFLNASISLDTVLLLLLQPRGTISTRGT